MVTCISKHSRNRYIGEEIALGNKLNEVLIKLGMVAEGVDTCKAVYNMAKYKNIEMPICEQIYKVLFESKSPIDAINQLMNRDLRNESNN